MLWIGGPAFALFSVGQMLNERSVESLKTSAILILVSLVLSGIGRRLFHIRRELVESVGLIPAIVSRINCGRFYWSIFFYGCVSFAVYGLVMFNNANGDEETKWILLTLLGIAASYFFFLIVRHTCPRCGRLLTHDNDAYDDTIEWTVYDNSAYAERGLTEYWHCPRCGKPVRLRSKRTVKQVKF